VLPALGYLLCVRRFQRDKVGGETRCVSFVIPFLFAILNAVQRSEESSLYWCRDSSYRQNDFTLLFYNNKTKKHIKNVTFTSNNKKYQNENY